MNDLDDSTLLERWREHRDGDAFAELARRHSSVVYDITCRVVGDRSQAEDVLQEALLDLALERTGKPAEVGVVAWLVRFSLCRARNRRSSERCRVRRQIVVGLERPEAAMPDESIELKEELEHALAGCDPEDRALLAMRFLHGWEYDRIASALSIQEGAARVRVHRALQTVRARVPAKDGHRIAPALGALPLVGMPPDALAGSIRTVVELAKVQLGAPANGLEHATAASRSFRVAVTLTGAALLFVAAAGATVVPEFRHGATGSGDEVASVPPGGALRPALADGTASAPAPVDTAFRRIPRPADWDGGLLRSFRDDDTDAPVRPASAPRADAVAAVAPANAAPAPGAAPEPAPRLDAADGPPADDSPSALRPKVRGACAAKGEPLSSEGERAGALGGSDPVVPVVADDPRDDERDDGSPVTSPGSTGRSGRARVVPEKVALDALPEETRVLVDQAQGLVRRLLDGAADETSSATTEPSADPAAAAVPAVAPAKVAVRRQIRQVQKHFGRLQRGLAAAGDGSVPASARAKRAQAQALRRVLGLLTQVVLTDGRVAGDLRWPAGADVAYALEEVIRVLGAQSAELASAAGDRLPTGLTGAAGGAR